MILFYLRSSFENTSTMAYSHKEIIHCLVRKKIFSDVKHLYINYYWINAKLVQFVNISKKIIIFYNPRIFYNLFLLNQKIRPNVWVALYTNKKDD